VSDTPTTEEADAPAEAEAAAEEVAVETDPVREAILEQLASQFKDAIVGSHIAKGDLWVRVANESWHDVVAFAKTALNFRFFDFLAGMDWLTGTDLSAEKAWGPDAEKTTPVVDGTGYAGGDTRFQVMLRLKNVETNVGVTFKVDLADDAPSVATITDLFAGADWHEREAWEMYGFEFNGHSGLRHLYLPGAFEGFPLRKDFPLLAREIKPWPGLVDKEPMPGEDAEPEEEAAE
jgi:NADH-quinone oxidoreductase subunit C